MTGSGTSSDPYVIWDATDLQNMVLDPTACYELGQDINAIATAGWNGGLGFDPVDVAALIQDYYPTGDDSVAGAWTIFPADGIYWNKVDEVVPDEDATYIETNVADAWVLFAFAGVTPPADSHQFYVTIDARARRMGAGGHTYRGYIRIAGQVYQSFDYEATGAAYGNRTSFFNNNPRTGLPWTVADLATIEAFGVYVIAAPVGLHFTQIRLRIEYGTFTFDGKGHNVSGLTINRPLEDDVGLFGDVHNAPISNVALTAAAITGDSNVGALAGDAYCCAFEDCSSSGSVYGNSGDVGGLIGDSDYPSTMNRCSSSCSVTAESSAIAGLIGNCYYGTLTDCHATGVITGIFNVWWPNRLAGLVGQAYHNTFIDCYATGAINAGGGSESGGLVGQNYDNTFTDCYATGNVTGDGELGGFAGDGSSSSFTRCYATGHITSTDYYAGGFVGCAGTCTFTRCYATGNVTSDHDYAGGFGAQLLGNCHFNQCYANGNVTITAGEDYAGGFYGQGSATNSFTECFATGDVSGDDQIGGFGGWGRGAHTDCYASGAVTGDDEVGGFVGWGSTLTLTRCYSRGRVTGNTNVGGLVGRLSSGTITDCFWDIETSGQSASAGGYGETTARMKDIATFLAAGWNMEEIEGVDFADGYPFLHYQAPGGSPVWLIFGAVVPLPPVPTVVTLPATGVT